MTDLAWEEPPPRARPKPKSGGKWETIAAALKANPLRWALVVEEVPDKQAAARARLNLIRWLGPGSFELNQRLTESGGTKCWARYIGEPS